ncbi:MULTISPECIES: hypothetical protein [Nocardia]|uniref:hypothetical protein n=1 Tax=Nocardia TaxID=1817 RepID=UPI000D6896CD|nr:MULTISPECIES: hypothetical protein [Nocardia]
MSVPLLFLDVDGPLNPSGNNHPTGYERHEMKPQAWQARFPGKSESEIRPLPVKLNPQHGHRLRELAAEGYELVWDTDYVARHHEGQSHLHIVHPGIGLTDRDFDALSAFGSMVRDTSQTL